MARRTWFFIFLSFLIIFVVLVLVQRAREQGQWQSRSLKAPMGTANPDIGTTFDDFALPQVEPNAEGTWQITKKADVSSLIKNSKMVLVNFWATWCAPCVQEFPSLMRLAMANGDAMNLTVIAVSVDSDQNAMARFLKKASQGRPSKRFIVLSDSKSDVAAKYGTFRLPETYVLDSSRRLLRKIVGAQPWDSEGFTTFLRSLKAP